MKNKLNEVIQPPECLGMLGGGQLGRFFTISAQKMGYSVMVLDPDKKSPAGKIADKMGVNRNKIRSKCCKCLPRRINGFT